MPHFLPDHSCDSLPHHSPLVTLIPGLLALCRMMLVFCRPVPPPWPRCPSRLRTPPSSPQRPSWTRPTPPHHGGRLPPPQPPIPIHFRALVVVPRPRPISCEKTPHKQRMALFLSVHRKNLSSLLHRSQQNNCDRRADQGLKFV